MPNDAPGNHDAQIHTLWTRLCSGIPFISEIGARQPFNPAGVDHLISSMRPDGSWADVDYANGNLKDWDAARHLQRLANLGVTWLRRDPSMPRPEPTLKAMLRGLDYWYSINPKNPNWWWNQIGGPLILGDALLCIKGDCNRSYIERAVPSLECHAVEQKAFTGQNLVWVSFVQIRHGILTDDASRISRAFGRIAAEVRVFPDEEGIQPDMSFHQHGKLLYNGGYGQNFAMDVGRLIALTDSTRFAMPRHVVDRFVSLMLDGSRWMVRGNTFDPSTIGREISRVGLNADRFRAGLGSLAQIEHPRRDEVLASLAVTPASGQSMVAGNRFFWSSDFMAHHRPGYSISVRMTSNRILRADGAHCGGEGRVCHHMADGVTHLMRDGNEYRDIYPVWNWRQIPGTTVAQHAGEFDGKTLVGRGQHAFAGGASDGALGCAAMDFTRDDLHARKAWFLFNEGLVALGAGIQAGGEAPIRTTINQCHWRGGAFLKHDKNTVAADEHAIGPGDAFWHDGFAYHILDGRGTLRLGLQSGAWSDCGVGSPERITLPVFNAGLDHGTRPDGATYAYAVLQSPRPGETDFATPHIAVVSNTPALQAVWHTSEQRGQAVFYEPGEVAFPDGQRVGVDRACILLYRPVKYGEVVLTFCEPGQQEGEIGFRLDEPIDAQIRLSLPVGEYAGASQSVRLQVL